jgi:hypothetical protein
MLHEIELKNVVTAANELDVLGQHKVADQFDFVLGQMVKEAGQENWFQQKWQEFWGMAQRAGKSTAQAWKEFQQAWMNAKTMPQQLQGGLGNSVKAPSTQGGVGNLGTTIWNAAHAGGIVGNALDQATQSRR